MHDYTCLWFRKAFTWKGRATRSEFWWPQVEIFLIILLLSIMALFGISVCDCSNGFSVICRPYFLNFMDIIHVVRHRLYIGNGSPFS